MKQEKNIIVFTQQDFQSNFLVNPNPPLGSGHDAKVYLAMHKRTVNEIKILKLIDHPGIVQIKGHAQDYTCVLLEYMPHDTFLRILKKGPFHISLSKTLASHLIHILATLHNHQIAHCDIKPENILIAADYKVKLCDFGFARITQQLSRPPGGTPGYTAPEIYKGNNLDLFKCDIFALGVVIFIIVMGFPPFQSNDPTLRDQWWNMILNKQYDIFWKKCEQYRQQKYPLEFKDMIMQMLEPDPDKRINITQLSQHSFLQNGASIEQIVQELQKRVKK
ncbi:unnamed protein product [Paramecium primaurelia]|uniref:Protein kinase domain-containing protein n=2 Tax=Paramecium primaurelia TaxID=5886 RepID=A0A8S1KTP2_PARPR|nr:unnamed protein product [Paramecium primaurelia]